MKYRKVQFIKLKEELYESKQDNPITVCMADGGVYIRHVYDMNPSYGQRYTEEKYFPNSDILEIEFERKY